MSETGHIEIAKRRSRLAATFAATALVALVPVTQAAGSQDLRSPDTRDAAQSAKSGQSQDLRSPDTRDAASGRRVVQGERQDLRSPDARDAAARPPVQAPVVSGDSSADIEWVYLAVGGFALLVLVGTASTARRRRRRVARSLVGADG